MLNRDPVVAQTWSMYL